MSLLDMVDKDTLLDIQDSYMGYLGSSGGIYDISGEYIAFYAASGYCKFLNNVSKKLCIDVENDDAAISSGNLICYEHCCFINLECIRSEKPEEYECPGGILMYAVPIIADGMVIGSISAGVSNPPQERNHIRQIAEQYHVDYGQLTDMAAKHKSRPDCLFQAARQHILTASRIIGVIYEKNLYQKTFTDSNSR
jgi:ligand-binding sensor protein